MVLVGAGVPSIIVAVLHFTDVGEYSGLDGFR